MNCGGTVCETSRDSTERCISGRVDKLKLKIKIEEGGFILAHWDGTPETEEKIKEDTKATIRCIPLEADEESLQPGVCMVTGKPSARRVLFARAY